MVRVPPSLGPRTQAFVSSRSPRDTRGVTLLEVVIASFLVAVVTLGMAEFFARGRGAFDQEERKRVATLLAQEALESAVATPYDLIAGSASGRTIANVSYTIAVTVQNNAPEPNMKTVRSAVTWQARPGVTRSVSLLTMVYRG